MSYRAPVDDMVFTLKHVAGLGEMLEQGAYPDLAEDLVDAILQEAGRFATEEIAPRNAQADKEGCHLQEDGTVSTPNGWKELYHNWAEGGWNSLNAGEEFGGQGLPLQLAAAAMDMWNQGSMGFAIGPTLTMGAVEALEKHASQALKDTYLAKLVSGEWMGTMNLTEPSAGSDLNAMRTKAEAVGDGTYKITGQKIFITYGDHELTDNIIHLVLARLPDAPAGTRGISLFLVPKYFVNDDGSLGARNDLRAAGVEHKMGIHASATCTMAFGDKGGAIGWLIGEENRGLACMFTMMNNARLMVGIQGVGVAERASQQAHAYAADRKQGKAIGTPKDGEMEPILVHPDVKRNLLTMKAMTEAVRSISYRCAFALDQSHLAKAKGDAESAKHWQERAGILTPIAKAFSTDIGSEVASIGVQIHGGMGYIEETGAAQYMRDARIAQIYEGTNGIQAIDLVTRKLPLSNGAAVKEMLVEMGQWAKQASESNNEILSLCGKEIADCLEDLNFATEWLLSALKVGRTNQALAGATPYLRIFGLTLGGVLMIKGAIRSKEKKDPSEARRLGLLRFYAVNLAPQTSSLLDAVVNGAQSVMETEAILV